MAQHAQSDIKMPRVVTAVGWTAAVVAARMFLISSAADAALSTFNQVSIGAKALTLAALAIATAYMLVVCGAAGALVGGRVLPKATGHISLKLCLGGGVVAFVGVILAHTHLLYWQSVLVVGFLFLLFTPPEQSLSKRLKQSYIDLRGFSGTELTLVSVLAIYLLPRLLESTLPQGQGDPIYYHVASAWWWGEAHQFVFYDWAPWWLQGGIFEYLYVLMQTLVPQRLGLLTACQMTHAFFGLVLAPTICYHLAQSLLQNRVAALLTVLAFITIPYDSMTLIRAKNDGFVLCSLAASMFFLFSWVTSFERQLIIPIYVFLALALAAKHSALFHILPTAVIVITTLVSHRFKVWNVHAVGIFVCVVIGAPMFIRNALCTGNPFFPAFATLFPSPFMDALTIAEAQSYTSSPAPFLEALWVQFKIALGAKPLFLLCVAALPWTRKQPYRSMALFVGLTILLLAIVTGTGTGSFRFSYFIFVPLAILAVSGLARLAVRFAGKRQTMVLVVSALALMLPTSQVEIPMSRLVRRVAPFYGSNDSFLSYIAAEKPAMRMFAWISARFQHGRIISNYTSESLFLAVPISIYTGEVRTNYVFSATSAKQFAERFREAGFTLFLYRRGQNVFDGPRPWISDLTEDFAEIHREGDLLLYQLR